MMQINNMVVNNVWTPVLMFQSDTEQAYGSVIEDGNKRYNVTPLRSWQDADGYHYWFIVNSTEIIPDVSAQIAALTEQIEALGQQVVALSIGG